MIGLTQLGSCSRIHFQFSGSFMLPTEALSGLAVKTLGKKKAAPDGGLRFRWFFRSDLALKQ
jgi:hypothetical protein